jgi:hypothetical protein
MSVYTLYESNRTDKATTTIMKSWLIAFFFRSKYIKRKRDAVHLSQKYDDNECIYTVEQKKERKDETRSTYIHFFFVCTVDMS